MGAILTGPHSWYRALACTSQPLRNPETMITVPQCGCNQMRMTKAMISLILCLMAGEAAGATIEGVYFPDRHPIESGSLAVRGVGMLKYMYVIKVYVAAF
jgi:hypothetical protein